MLSGQARCKKCGRPLNKDEQQNFFSFCYNCFKDFKSSKMRKATAMRIIGIISLIFVSVYIFLFSFSFFWVRPLGKTIFIIGSIIAVIIPVLLITKGTKNIRKWEMIYKVKPVEPQELQTTPPTDTNIVQKFCPHCGNKITDQYQKFCVNCGAQIHS